jgi:peptidylprolyl isomerase
MTNKEKTKTETKTAEVKIATPGSNILFHYKGTYDDGELFDDSRKGSSDTAPLKVLLGTNRLLEAFETALVGMKAGDVKSISLAPQEAFGDHNPTAYVVAPKDKFPPNYQFEIGAFVEGNAINGRRARGRIESVGPNTVTLDMNHPLAGKKINYEIELVDILEKVKDMPPAIAKPKDPDCKTCKGKKSTTPAERKNRQASVAKDRARLRSAARKTVQDTKQGPNLKTENKTTSTIKRKRTTPARKTKAASKKALKKTTTKTSKKATKKS